MIQQQTQNPPIHTSKITIPINNISSSSSSSVSTTAANTSANTNTQTTGNTAINTEEFAKLDALLEDLLAEVEQPILLNKYNENLTQTESFNPPTPTSNTNNSNTQSRNLPINSDEIERSVDWLNEQKEILRSRKELNQSKYSSVQKISDTNLSYSTGLNDKNFQELKSRTLTKSTPQFNEKGSQDNDEEAVPSLNGALNGYMTSTQRPPLSPTSQRQIYSSSAQPHQSFRSLSTNPTLLRNINETDDDVNMTDVEFDRYSQRSFRTNSTGVNTVQRSKYHTVSNDFVECTRPPAPTPVPSSVYQSRRSENNNPGKRALSAPPVELGKVMLQRMELKSPVTVRQGSAVPFEQPKMIQYPYEQQLAIQPQRVQTPVNNGRYIESNPNMILKQQNQNMDQYQPQQISTRNAFLNKSFAEQPRQIAYTNGYETDSGIANGYGTYRGPSRNNSYNQHSQVYNNENVYVPHKQRNIINGYRTIGGATSRSYNANNDQQGYETDTGLIKLRQALDNNRRALSRNDLPIHQQQVVPNGYYYHGGGRSVTPSFNSYHTYNHQPQQFRNNPYSRHVPIQDSQFAINAYSSDVDNMEMMSQNGQYLDNNEFLPQYQPQQQYSNNNGMLDMEGNITYLTEDGRQLMMNEIEQELDMQQNNFNTIERQHREYGHNPISQSMIVHQQRAPSAYSMSRETPSRLGYTSSATNISVQPPPQYLNGHLSTSQQITKQEVKPEAGSRRSSANSLATGGQDANEVLRNHPKSVKNTQNFWYKPKISRDEAINLLKDKTPGTFLIRDSNNFPGAYGLALKVDKPPANVQIKPGADPLNELVRHFLIEPTTKGVRIKGCYNEPIFGSLAALVYQHSLTPLALPIKLNLPQEDLVLTTQSRGGNQQQKTSGNNSSKQQSQQQHQSQSSNQDGRHLLDKGAACHVYYLCTTNIDDKNGLEAITYALSTNKSYLTKDTSQLVVIQFKVTSQGITLTDINKKKFLRQHFPTNTVSYCAIEEKMIWPTKLDKISKPRIFGLITKPSANLGNNECHLFIELDQDQPAIAIVDFINRYLIPSKVKKN